MGMQKGQNYNHPEKGYEVKKQPLRDQQTLKKIKRHLQDHPRNFCLFVLAINTAFRANELLSLEAGQVRYLSQGEALKVWQKKTKKYRTVALNETCVNAVKNLLDSRHFDDKDFLFAGRSRDKALTIPAFSKLVKKWCEFAGETGHSAHDLRRTWAYFQWKNKTPVALIQKALGHATEQQTLEYICVQSDDVNQILGLE
ncbi:MAG: tyrosine-type recombinase/integrase, partial [Thiotrichaceae bacterium]|nr:tyrosine-type recombinase/integrase [Thiotrichaceae bacterium]